MSGRVLIILTMVALVLLPGSGFAIESGPSNTVGFWKLDVNPGFTQMSFPLLPQNKSLDNVLQDQLTGGTVPEESDQIMRWDAQHGRYQVAWYDLNSGHWTGEFDQVSESESYWIYVQPDHPAVQTIVTYGAVVEDPVYDMGQMTPGYNAVGSVWAMPASIPLSGLDGFQGGMYLFLSDLIMTYDSNSGNFIYTWKDADDEWQGDLLQFEPLKGYWIYVAPGHNGFDWSVYPQPNPAGLNLQAPPQIYPDNDVKVKRTPPPLPTVKTSSKIPLSSASGKGGRR